METRKRPREPSVSAPPLPETPSPRRRPRLVAGTAKLPPPLGDWDAIFASFDTSLTSSSTERVAVALTDASELESEPTGQWDDVGLFSAPVSNTNSTRTPSQSEASLDKRTYGGTRSLRLGDDAIELEEASEPLELIHDLKHAAKSDSLDYYLQKLVLVEGQIELAMAWVEEQTLYPELIDKLTTHLGDSSVNETIRHLMAINLLFLVAEGHVDLASSAYVPLMQKRPSVATSRFYRQKYEAVLALLV